MQEGRESCGGGVSLRRHGCNSDVLRRMRASEATCDVTFLVDGQRFPAHRGLLGATSPVFERMFLSGMRESTQSEIAVHEVDAASWKTMLDYIYAVEVRLSSVDQGLKLLQCAHRFHLESLESSVAEYLASVMDRTNCCDLVVVADRIQRGELKDLGMKVLRESFHEFCDSPALAQLDLDTMEALLSDKKLRYRSELDVLRSVVRWLVERGHKVDDLLRARLSGDAPAEMQCEERDGAMSTVPGGEIDRLTRHFVLDQLSTQDLLDAIALCHEARLADLLIQCVNKRSYSPRMELTTPIPPQQRAVRPRRAPCFTLLHRFYEVGKAMDADASSDGVPSPWIHDRHEYYSWRLEVSYRGWYSVRDEWVSVSLQINNLIANAMMELDKEILFQLFVMDPSMNKVERVAETIATTVGDLKCGMVCGAKKMILTPEFKQLVDTHSDSIVFGATIYFMS